MVDLAEAKAAAATNPVVAGARHCTLSLPNPSAVLVTAHAPVDGELIDAISPNGTLKASWLPDLHGDPL